MPQRYTVLPRLMINSTYPSEEEYAKLTNRKKLALILYCCEASFDSFSIYCNVSGWNPDAYRNWIDGNWSYLKGEATVNREDKIFPDEERDVDYTGDVYYDLVSHASNCFANFNQFKEEGGVEYINNSVKEVFDIVRYCVSLLSFPSQAWILKSISERTRDCENWLWSSPLIVQEQVRQKECFSILSSEDEFEAINQLQNFTRESKILLPSAMSTFRLTFL